jgi:ABC-2 type transport system permease protein
MSGLYNPTVAMITLRATLSRKRAFLFAIPAAILILLTVALKASRPPLRPWPSHVLGTFGFSVLIPLTALIIGTSVLAPRSTTAASSTCWPRRCAGRRWC